VLLAYRQVDASQISSAEYTGLIWLDRFQRDARPLVCGGQCDDRSAVYFGGVALA
jgi:hypothetical protein